MRLIFGGLLGLAALVGVSRAPAQSRPSALENVQDYSLQLDQPAFFGLLDEVAVHPLPTETPEPVPWRELLERPASHRGEWILVTGRVGRFSEWKFADAALAARYGRVWQFELHANAEPIACTLIVLSDPGPVPIGAEVIANGRFLAIRQYLDARGTPRHAALVISPGILSVQQTSQRTDSSAESTWITAMCAVVGGLLLAVLLVRRQSHGRISNARELQSQRPAPMNLADDLEAWAREQNDR